MLEMAATLREYRLFWLHEPLARKYIIATLIDDVGVAASIWTSQLITTRMFISQTDRASVMSPFLIALILGIVLGGPLADRSRRKASLLPLARWRVVLIIRTFETLALAYLALQLASGAPSAWTITPYIVVGGFCRALARPSRQAFEADLLLVTNPMPAADGGTAAVKLHLAVSTSLRELANTLADLVGLAAGGLLVSAVGGALWVPFAFDILTNLAFILLVAGSCRPLIERSTDAPATQSIPCLKHLRASLTPKLLLAAGLGLLVGAVNESYDGKMVLMHQMGAPDETIRLSEFFWQLATVLGLLALPRITAAIRKLFISFAWLVAIGGAAAVAAAVAIGSGNAHLFVVILCGTNFISALALYIPIIVLIDGSSIEHRGSAIAAYILAGLVVNLLMQQIAAILTGFMSIHQMLLYLGMTQSVLALSLVVSSKRVSN